MTEGFSVLQQLNLIHEYCFQVTDKLSYHLERIEAGYSSFKNLSCFSNLFVTVFMFIMFYIKNFVGRLVGYQNKHVFYDSYIEGKEYNLLMTTITFIAFNLTYVNIASPTAIALKTNKEQENTFDLDISRRRSILVSKNWGNYFTKIFIDGVNSFKYFYFFMRFNDLHQLIFSNTEEELLQFSLESISLLIACISYFTIDFYLLNSTSTTAKLITYICYPVLRKEIRTALKKRVKLYLIIFMIYFMLFYKKIYLFLNITEELNEKISELTLLFSTFILFRLEPKF